MFSFGMKSLGFGVSGFKLQGVEANASNTRCCKEDLCINNSIGSCYYYY